MNTKHLQQILSDYSQMSVDSLIELKNLIEDYPYCQTAQALYLLNLKRLGEDMFETRLPYAAICVNNRQKLKYAVEKVDEILEKETKKTEKSEQNRHSERSKEPAAISRKQILRYAQNNTLKSSVKIKTFRSKTISDLLNLQEESPKPMEITRIRLPQTQVSEDFVLEQLRQETLSKVNERLLEIRKTEMVNVDFSEKPKHVIDAQTIIDNVIATNPKISKADHSELKHKTLSHWKTKEERSLREDYDIVSETLALLYVAQGAPEKARQIYKTLSQKYPEKAEYFTQLSKQIKSNHKPKTKK